MLTALFTTMTLEKARILVEIFIGDLVHNSLIESNPRYGLLLWYYQFVRAESYLSIGIFFIVLTCIVISWWYSSYIHEEEQYEVLSMIFPNQSIEWWYDWMIENMFLAAYFLYMAFIDLYFYWKPVRPTFFLGLNRTSISRFIPGERTFNIFTQMFSNFNFKGNAWPFDSSALERWAYHELRATSTLVQVRRELTSDGLGFFRPEVRHNSLLRRFWLRLRRSLAEAGPTAGYKRFEKYLKMSAAEIKRRSVARIPKPVEWYVEQVQVPKVSRYVKRFSITTRKWYNYHIEALAKYRGFNYGRKNWDERKSRAMKRIKRHPPVRRFILLFSKYWGDPETFSVNLKRHNRKANRGREFLRYHIICRRRKNLVPLQKLTQLRIRKGRRREINWLTHRRLCDSRKWSLLNDRRAVRRTFFNPLRPRWHRRYWRQYWTNADETSRGVSLTGHINVHWKLWPVTTIYFIIHSICWEEDEFDMYEEEFEDWDLEFDLEAGRINNADLESEFDADLRTLKTTPDEETVAMLDSESKQAFKDEQAHSDNTEVVMDEDYDEENDDEYGEDFLQFSVDYWGGIFEYYTDPDADNLERLQLHPIFGYDMPPAWGRLQEASTHYKNLFARADGIIYAYYQHNVVFVEDGVTSSDRWWDGEVKSWRHDGQSRNYLTWAGGKMDEIYAWYFNEYRILKRDNEPEVYQKMLEFDKRERQKRPHYHGLAFWRGYEVLREDFIVRCERIWNTVFTDKQRQFANEYAAELEAQKRRGEWVPDELDEAKLLAAYKAFKEKNNMK